MLLVYVTTFSDNYEVEIKVRGNMIRFIILPLMLLFIGCNSDEKDINRYIEVVGEGLLRVEPNQVQFSIKAEFVNPNLKKSVNEVNRVIGKVDSICESIIKEPFAISTSRIATNKDYSYKNGKRIFNGYQATQIIDVTLSDISKFEILTEKLLSTKISEFQHFRFTHSKKDSILRAADLIALKDAERSANKLAEASGVEIGSLNSIINFEPNQKSSSFSNQARFFRKGMRSSGFKISPELLEYKRLIKANYKIK